MDTRTGTIVSSDMIPVGQKRHFVPVIRDLTQHEKRIRQVMLYSPCVCGSGKKLKFCCYKGRN